MDISANISFKEVLLLQQPVIRSRTNALSIKSVEKPILVEESLPPFQGDDGDTLGMEPLSLKSAAERLAEELEEPLYETKEPAVPCQMLFSPLVNVAGFHVFFFKHELSDIASLLVRSCAVCSLP